MEQKWLKTSSKRKKNVKNGTKSQGKKNPWKKTYGHLTTGKHLGLVPVIPRWWNIS